VVGFHTGFTKLGILPGLMETHQKSVAAEEQKKGGAPDLDKFSYQSLLFRISIHKLEER
jgi:hypothetical protein